MQKLSFHKISQKNAICVWIIIIIIARSQAS